MRQISHTYSLALGVALGLLLAGPANPAAAQDKAAAKCLKKIDGAVKKAIRDARKQGATVELDTAALASDPKCTDFDPTTIGYTGCPAIAGTDCDVASTNTTLSGYLQCIDCGTVDAERVFRGLQACGNGKVESELGEECDPPGSVGQCDGCQICLADCTCQSPPAINCTNTAGGPNLIGVTVEKGGDLDAGWTGIGHNQGVVLKSQAFGCLDNCDLSTSSVCTGKGGTDLNGQTFGPPLPLLAENVATCVNNKLDGDIDFSFDVATGEATMKLSLTSEVFLTGDQRRPCPTCSGSFIGDAGKCSAGKNRGKSCTVEGLTEKFGNTSSDCPPEGGDRVGDVAVSLDPVTSESITQKGALTCSGGGSALCVCKGSPAVPSKPNGCDNPESCSPDNCPSDDPDNVKAGFDQACCKQGSKTIACFEIKPDADDNNIKKQTITRSGERAIPTGLTSGAAWPDTDYPKIAADGKVASVFCIPATNENTIDTTSGLPGPGAFILPGDTCIDFFPTSQRP